MVILPLSKNKNRNASGKGTTTDDQDDTVFQQTRPRQQTSTSRSLSSLTTPNGFLDSCVSIEHFPSGKNGERPYAVGTLLGLAESSGRDSDEDEDVICGDEEDEEEEEVEMVDHACQTRESLFDRNNAEAGPSQSYLRGAATAQPRVCQQPADSRYKAERTIEIAQTPPPTSVARMMFSKANTNNSSSAASSKSGADVVVLH